MKYLFVEEVRDKMLMDMRPKFDVELGDCAYALENKFVFFLHGQYLFITKFHRMERYARSPSIPEPAADRQISKFTPA